MLWKIPLQFIWSFIDLLSVFPQSSCTSLSAPMFLLISFFGKFYDIDAKFQQCPNTSAPSEYNGMKSASTSRDSLGHTLAQKNSDSFLPSLFFLTKQIEKSVAWTIQLVSCISSTFEHLLRALHKAWIGSDHLSSSFLENSKISQESKFCLKFQFLFRNLEICTKKVNCIRRSSKHWAVWRLSVTKMWFQSQRDWYVTNMKL